jgi:predicted dehydrogenase
LKAICGRDAKAVREVAGKFGWETAVTNWRAVIDDPEIDIIDICTPNDSHAEIAIAAAKAGKAILCEKPLVMRTASGGVQDTLIFQAVFESWSDAFSSNNVG